ncbi:hypothetical protein NDU88_004960 [Pleurodeles waltl]|uniref:Uncharacterized protein n=1 Tax=Pleurodeles waltl TaxID=8319 RepID=A0AAV7NNT7_PLEWA|nr:hypothetical protein NDU88_004960 [Pleurodeles waltl]
MKDAKDPEISAFPEARNEGETPEGGKTHLGGGAGAGQPLKGNAAAGKEPHQKADCPNQAPGGAWLTQVYGRVFD